MLVINFQIQSLMSNHTAVSIKCQLNMEIIVSRDCGAKTDTFTLSIKCPLAILNDMKIKFSTRVFLEIQLNLNSEWKFIERGKLQIFQKLTNMERNFIASFDFVSFHITELENWLHQTQIWYHFVGKLWWKTTRETLPSKLFPASLAFRLAEARFRVSVTCWDRKSFSFSCSLCLESHYIMKAPLFRGSRILLAISFAFSGPLWIGKKLTGKQSQWLGGKMLSSVEKGKQNGPGAK